MTTTAQRPATRTAPTPVPSLRPWHALMLLGGALGIVTGSWQTVERIAWAANPGKDSWCEINAALSCSSVYSHWQSSALGIPNSLVSVPVFTMLAATGLAGLLGTTFARSYLATLLGITVFMAGFVTWYMEQSAFAIGVLCLFCVGCAVNIVIAGVGLTRVAAAGQALGEGRAGRELRLLVASGADVIAWVGLAGVVAVMLVVGLAF